MPEPSPRRDLELLQGAVDIHIHHGPDLYPRIQDPIELAQDAKAAGMRAVCLKTHNFPTAPMALLARMGAVDPDGPWPAPGEATRGLLRIDKKTRVTSTMSVHPAPMRVITRREPGLHIGERAGKTGEVGLLRQVTHCGARLREARATIRLGEPGASHVEARHARRFGP